MFVERTQQSICEETVERISRYLTTHHISDYSFSRRMGMYKATYGRIARYERKLSLDVICAAGQIFGFRMIGDEWNPYPGYIHFLDLTPTQVYDRVRDNLTAAKGYFQQEGLAFTRFASSGELSSDGIYSIMRGRKKYVLLSTIIELSLMLKLPNVGAMYANRDQFMEHIKGVDYSVYKKPITGS